jgi:16S rRNA (guanine527-N7)-methyltransferase
MTDYLPSEIEFNNLVIEWNKKINLVSRRKSDVFDLINDSRIFLNYIDFDPNPVIMDLGTGGGFPGIVIKIHHPEIKMVLIDSILKKVTAVCDITSKLKLTGITSICTRAENMDKNNVFKHVFDYVVSRSVGELADLLKWSRGLLKPGGKLITLKGGDIDEEIRHAKKLRWIKGIEKIPVDEKEIIIVSI